MMQTLQAPAAVTPPSRAGDRRGLSAARGQDFMARSARSPRFRIDLDAASAWVNAEIALLDRQRRAEEAGWLLPGLIGYVVTWSDRCTLRDGSTENFAPGAFDACLRTSAIACCLDHDRGRAIGGTADGSLMLRSDRTGLRLELTPHNTTDGRAALAHAAGGRITGASFTFVDGVTAPAPLASRHRTIIRATLHEVSIMIGPKLPMYRNSWITRWTEEAQRRADLASLDGYERELDELEAEC